MIPSPTFAKFRRGSPKIWANSLKFKTPVQRKPSPKRRKFAQSGRSVSLGPVFYCFPNKAFLSQKESNWVQFYSPLYKAIHSVTLNGMYYF
jgi:hypothetical protein